MSFKSTGRYGLYGFRGKPFLGLMYLTEDERELYEARLKWLRDEERVNNLLKLGVEIDKIIEVSGLSKEEIEQLKDKSED